MASHAFKQLRLGSLAAAAALALTAQAANVKPVTWDEIANDAKTTGDVLTYGLDLTAQRYSPAKTLNTRNVAGLVPAWSYSFGGEKQRGQEAQALIHDGVIYVTASYSRFVALDARSGKRLWTYEHRLPEDIRPCCDVVNRGPAIYGDKVYFGTLDARDPVPFMLGGQRLSPWLPWYRGRQGEPMQPESQALCQVVEGELLSHDFSIAVDCHSGFGTSDRIWFPYASTRLPIAHLPEMHALAEILDQTQLHHPYVFEPQSSQYLTHGDLWDHLYQRACLAPACIHLPLTLEMGSWLWVKKNPRQMLSLLGFFNPLIAHRHARVLRRHIHWLEFIGRAACGHRGWVPTGPERARHRELALRRWYDMGGVSDAD